MGVYVYTSSNSLNFWTIKYFIFRFFSLFLALHLFENTNDFVFLARFEIFSSAFVHIEIQFVW